MEKKKDLEHLGFVVSRAKGPQKKSLTAPKGKGHGFVDMSRGNREKEELSKNKGKRKKGEEIRMIFREKRRGPVGAERPPAPTAGVKKLGGLRERKERPARQKKGGGSPPMFTPQTASVERKRYQRGETGERGWRKCVGGVRRSQPSRKKRLDASASYDKIVSID